MSERKTPEKKGLLYTLCNGACILLTTLVILICLPFTLPRIFGIQPYAIVSGSMEPEIPVGSIVYVGKVQPEELISGEIITFYTGTGSEGAVTHRVVENRNGEKELVTKGDANMAPDPMPVSYERVVGRVKLHIPGLGRLFPLISGTAGKIRLLAVLLAAILIRTVGVRIERQR
ncbi:MAG: signal peptidase I [Lachnospiraceae bacterium]|nr:signal peptidase I [Lachnospiraceae bacterium]